MRILPGDAYELPSPLSSAETRARIEAETRTGDLLAGHAGADGFELTLGPRALAGLDGRLGAGLSSGFAPLRRVRIQGRVLPAGGGAAVHVQLAPPLFVLGFLAAGGLLLGALGVGLLAMAPGAWSDLGLLGFTKGVLLYGLGWLVVAAVILGIGWTGFVPEAQRIRKVLQGVVRG
ncbi:MAG: hypothetical protein H6742_08400 [Alphaproteobacteria bacterium]|nr:hypothetical protein [Alphaproteobacteria bacterium]